MQSSVVLTHLEWDGNVAIAFHDENGNGKLDRNFLGVPAEPYGFSNKAEGFLGPPSFEEGPWPGAITTPRSASR